MAFEIRITPFAKKNIREATSYYQDKVSVKVSQRFITDYETTIKKLQQIPHFKIYYKDFRGIPFKKFPYMFFIN